MEIMRTGELSKVLKTSDATVLDLAKRGKIPAIRVGHEFRFDLGEVLAALKVKSNKNDQLGEQI
jgi:excisionase family DNA binding protein